MEFHSRKNLPASWPKYWFSLMLVHRLYCIVYCVLYLNILYSFWRIFLLSKANQHFLTSNSAENTSAWNIYIYWLSLFKKKTTVLRNSLGLIKRVFMTTWGPKWPLKTISLCWWSKTVIFSHIMSFWKTILKDLCV